MTLQPGKHFTIFVEFLSLSDHHDVPEEVPHGVCECDLSTKHDAKSGRGHVLVGPPQSK